MILLTTILTIITSIVRVILILICCRYCFHVSCLLVNKYFEGLLLLHQDGYVLLTEILLPRIARLASNRSTTGNCPSNFNKRASSKSSNSEIRARKARIDKCELDEGFQPYRPSFRSNDRNTCRHEQPRIMDVNIIVTVLTYHPPFRNPSQGHRRHTARQTRCDYYYYYYYFYH